MKKNKKDKAIELLNKYNIKYEDRGESLIAKAIGKKFEIDFNPLTNRWYISNIENPMSTIFVDTRGFKSVLKFWRGKNE